MFCSPAKHSQIEVCFVEIMKRAVSIMVLSYKINWHGLQFKTFQAHVEFPSPPFAETAKTITYRQHDAVQFYCG